MALSPPFFGLNIRGSSAALIAQSLRRDRELPFIHLGRNRKRAHRLTHGQDGAGYSTYY
jgi:hypothetical protein